MTKKNHMDAAYVEFTGNGKIDVLEAVQVNIAGFLYVAQAFIRHAAPKAVAINSWGCVLESQRQLRFILRRQDDDIPSLGHYSDCVPELGHLPYPAWGGHHSDEPEDRGCREFQG
ncbi:hypothetical protein F5X99DRAFT_390777 [Biscogniauxia marginata]|nr:hypothetical protein F5X99DRAFT_390777 [Biscogniauxia marginata]